MRFICSAKSRIVTAHGLVEFRGTLSMLLDRIESAAFEVAVFGRESSGKSSLLNYVLQTDVLPIGVTASGRDASEELPKPTGMPMMDLNEISQIIVIEKPRILSFLGKSMLASHIRRKLATDYDRALLEFLSLYANRLRRWMEQSINAVRNAFNAFADMYRAHFEAPPAMAGATDPSAIQNDLRLLRQWERSEAVVAVSN